MNSDRHVSSATLPPRRRLAAATLLACTVLFLAAIPAATAKTDSPASTSTSTPTSTVTSTSAEGVAVAAPEVPVSGEVEVPAPANKPDGRAKHASTSTTTPGQGAATVVPAAVAAPTTVPATRLTTRARKQAQKDAVVRRSEAAAQQNAVGADLSPAAASKKDEKTTKPKGPKAKAKAKEEREERAQLREQRKIEKGKIPPKTGPKPPPVTIEPVATPASTGGADPVIPAAAVVGTSASAGTTPPSIESSPAVVTPAPSDPHRAAAKHRRHRASTRTSGGALAAPAAVAAPLATLGLGGVRAAHRGTRSGGRSTHSSPAAPQSPIVRTITRIVGVVPLAVRILIGALLAIALALAIRGGFVAMRTRRLERQREQLLEDVGLLQAALLPAPPARIGPVGTSVAYRPAAGPGAGGDFYDVFALEDGQLAVIVGDISGHGREALPHTALVRFTLRAYLEAGLSPRDAVQTAGAVLEHQLGGSFATVVAATYNPRRRLLVYACAGHPRPIVLAPGSPPVAATTVCSAPPIGVGMRTGIRQTTVSIPGQSQACFFTDGVVEARVGSELFGAERLGEVLAALGSEVNAAELLDRVTAETDRRPDDMAACILNVEGDEAAPMILREELELDLEEVGSDRPEHLLLAYGIAPEEIERFMGSARAEIAESGSATLELSFGEGQPQLALRRENVALLHPQITRRRRRLRMSL
jgi:stage II sporulation SpoE-like protein